MTRFILASNRLPASFQHKGGHISIQPSTGGLATGLRPQHEASGGVWIGWPGAVDELSPEALAELEQALAARRLVPVHLSAEDIQSYYHEYSNGVLWPLFHYFTDRLPLSASSWEAYRKVNAAFANRVVENYREGDVVWVHDYHLFLVPQMVRDRLPHARIGFFLHIPFPSSEIFRLLPHRSELLEGVLGADLVGFHTHAYMRHFSSTVLRLLGHEFKVDRLQLGGREVRLGGYPLGVDAAAFEAYAQDPEVQAEGEAIRKEYGGVRILLGVDRLDYTKGIRRRLLAFERLLENEPRLRGNTQFLQVAITSRAEVPSYEQFKSDVDELVGRINGRFGTPGYAPIHYINRPFNQRRLAALYRIADVMVVTPLRDGLNLVAKEFVASQPNEPGPNGPGVLVLSEFAGAASELSEALIVNPYDIDGVAGALARALDMDRDEKIRRMGPMRERVRLNDVYSWAREFLADLDEASSANLQHLESASSPRLLERIAKIASSSCLTILLLDYDGTLVPLAPLPHLAAPDRGLFEVLEQLAAHPELEVHVVSGRKRDSLDGWLGHLPIALHAEHGLWSRGRDGGEWIQRPIASPEWIPQVRPFLETFVKGTPGSFIEEKTAGLAWHYRGAEPVFGASQARELRLLLLELFSNAPLEVISGEKVVEVRTQGIHKGIIAKEVLQERAERPAIVAIGDDRTDEDLFRALPPEAITIHVGPGLSCARHRLHGVAQVREVLSSFAASLVS